MMNARPAGMSSEDEDSDDCVNYYMSDSTEIKRPKGFHRFEPKPIDPEEALFTAIRNNEIEEVKSVFEKGVSLEALEGGWTPLMFACFNGLPEITKMLLDKGSNINFNKDYFTPLMAVCSNPSGKTIRKLECIRILLNHKVDIDAVDRFRTSSLMFAAKEGLTDVAKLLIDKGCKIDNQDKDGWSALFHAVFNNKVDTVDILISSGASVALIDRRQFTVYDIAISKGLDELAEKVKINRDYEEPEPTVFSVQPVVTMAQMLNELPSRSSGQNPGFPSDIYGMLQGMDLLRYADSFYKHNVQLGEFLVMDNKKLEKIGVLFSDHRNTLLKSLRRFHLHKWQKSSLNTKSKYETLELLDGVKLMGNIVRQLYVLQSTMSYMLANRQINNVTKELKKNIDEIRRISAFTEKEIMMIYQHSQYIDHVKSVRPVDLITSDGKSAKKIPNCFVKICLVILGFTLLWKQKKYFSFQFKST